MQMSFLYKKITHNIPYIIIKKFSNRKEKDSLLANHYPLYFHKTQERASAFTSKGSITLEASLVVPIFFFAMLCLVYLLEVMSIQMTMRNAIYSVGKEIAQQAYSSPMISTYGIQQHIIKNIGAEKLDKSIISGGTEGINCNNSVSNWNTAVIDLSVQYQLEIPILMFRIPIISCEEMLRVKGWTGYAAGAEEMGQNQVVYVTDYGLVYHKSMNCTYLELSIQAVRASEIDTLRSESGAKYYPCESCGEGPVTSGRVYITNYGNRFHTSLDCSKVKRNIYAVPLDEVYGLGGCSKCVK
jgi:hypothetical protein